MVFFRSSLLPCFSFLAYACLFAPACATHAQVRPELHAAREAYTRAMASPAAMLAPDKLMAAREALAEAEAAVPQGGGQNPQARDLAYIAERKAQLAETAGAQLISARQKTRRDKQAVALDDDEDDGDSEARKKGEED